MGFDTAFPLPSPQRGEGTDRAQCCCLKPVCRPDKAFKLHLAIRCTMPDATLSRLIMPTSSMLCVGRIRRLRRIRQASVMECTNGLFNSSLSGIAGITRDIRPQLAAPCFYRRGGMAGGTCMGLALANDIFTFTQRRRACLCSVVDVQKAIISISPGCCIQCYLRHSDVSAILRFPDYAAVPAPALSLIARGYQATPLLPA